MSSPGRAPTDQLLLDLREAVPGSEHLFDAVVGALDDAVTIRDRDDRIVYANRAALDHMGFRSWAEMREVPAGRIMADYDVTDEQGQAVTMDQIPSVRLLRGEPAEPLLIRTVHRQTGAVHWNLLKASPLRSSEGTIEATITIIEDVTDQRLAQLRAAYVARATSVLASSLDYEQTLQNVAELAVPTIADWCGVDLVGPRGERVPVAVAHVDPARLRLAEELRRYEPARPNPDAGVGAVLRTGEPALYPEVTEEMLEGAALDARHLELLRSVGMRSVAILPMRTAGHTLGTMTLVNAESGRVLQEDDVRLGSQIAERAAVAIENARLYSERSRIAHTLQQSLRPEPLPEIPGFTLASLYLPAVDGSEVGGDFYELWEVDEGWLLVVGDVTGKGVEAAVLTSLARHTLRTASEFVSSPAALLARLDRTLRAQPQPSICTALCVRLEAERLVLASGGHPLPLMIGPGGVEQLGTPGPLLGAFPDAQLTDVVARFPPEATLLAYTDGVTDAVREDGKRFGLERLLETLERCRDCSAQQVIDALSEALEAFGAGRHVDDTAAVVVRRTIPSGMAGAAPAHPGASA